MEQTLSPTAEAIPQSKHVPFSLPESGEMLLTDVQCAEVLQCSVAHWWALARVDPRLTPVRVGPRFTRWRATELRRYLASLSSGSARTSPAQLRRPTEAEPA